MVDKKEELINSLLMLGWEYKHFTEGIALSKEGYVIFFRENQIRYCKESDCRPYGSSHLLFRDYNDVSSANIIDEMKIVEFESGFAI